MNYYLIAGEASGDLHAANLMKALKRIDSEAIFRCWGGDLMQQAGGKLVKHYKTLAFMGIWEVLKNLQTIAKNLDFCKKDMAKFKPDVLILVDYSGFNLRVAKWAKKNGFKVFYYISPQVWASRQGRVATIKKYVDRLFVILPFEKDFYQQCGMEVDFVGHPLLDAIADFEANWDKSQLTFPTHKPIIALLPGSRKQEIRVMLKMMLRVVNHFSNYQFIIAAAPALNLSFYEKIIRESGLSTVEIKLVQNQTYPLLKVARAALVTSGTATLETALFEVPQVVCYKGNWASYQIARRLIKVPYISLVNLIENKQLVKELIQTDLTEENLVAALSVILQAEKAAELKVAYKGIKTKLGNEGASLHAATLMVNYLNIPMEG